MLDQHPKHDKQSTFERINNQSKLLRLQQASEKAIPEASAAVRRGDIQRDDPIMDSGIQLLDVLLAQTGPQAPSHTPEEETEDLRELTKFATDFYVNTWTAVQEQRLAEDNPLAQAALELRDAISPQANNSNE